MSDEKKFGFIPVASTITPLPLNEIAQDIQTELLHMGGGYFSDDKILESVPLFYLVLTGGTEQKVLKLWKERKEKFSNEPVILLVHPGNNSLPA